ncbi:hypothetical protein A9Q99_06750 [Gammaproteobacteria bacterium 45_16_T64]|nr:hypothetical protein A9Q99_06750 [Gammaproteobacteria bacterium 45_16_T64]
MGLFGCANHSSLNTLSAKNAHKSQDTLSPVKSDIPVQPGTEFQEAIQVIDSYRVIDEVSLNVTPDDWMLSFLLLLDPDRDFLRQKDVDVIMQASSNLYQKLLSGEPQALKSLYDVVNWRMAITVDQASVWLRNEPPMRPKVKYHKPTEWAESDSELRRRWRDKVYYLALPELVEGKAWKSVSSRVLSAYQQQQSCLQAFNNGKLITYAVKAYADLVGVNAEYVPSTDLIVRDTGGMGCDLPLIRSLAKNRQLRSDKYPILAGGVATTIAVLTLPNFDNQLSVNKHQQDKFIGFIRDYNDSGVSGVVVDLRGNSGDSISDGILVAKALLGGGLLVQKKDFGGAVSTVEYVGESRYRGAIVILVDRHTQGAAEVLASTMQGRKRGIVIGERSGGVGNYRDVTRLESGVVEVVIGEYMALAGHAIKNLGVSPDIELVFMKSRMRHDARDYVVALSKSSSFIRPSRQRQYPLDAPLPYLRMQQKLRAEASEAVPRYVLMKRQEESYAAKRNIMDVYSQRKQYKKLLSAQAYLAKSGVRDIELFQGLQITQDWLGVKNAGMRSW